MPFDRFSKSILFGTVAWVVGIALLAGALFILATSSITADIAHRQSAHRLGELLDTVESTASIACFVQDAQLAAELVGGLLKNSEVAGARLSAGDRELARAQRGDGTSADPAAGLVRPIVSPFDKNHVVGEIRIDANSAAIDRAVAEQTGYVRVLLAVQLAIVVAAVVAIVIYGFIRPIKAMSDGLHRLDAPAGERLPPPRGHEHNEIGRLATDINDLAGSLVAALDVEHALRVHREMDELKYRSIFDNAASGIFIADGAGRLHSYNHFFSRLSGLPAEEGGDVADLLALPWREPQQLRAMVEDCAHVGDDRSEDLEFRGPDHVRRWLQVALRAVGNGQIQGIVNDVTERKEAEVSARQLTVTDALTGLGNRRGLEQHMAEALAAAAPLALMLVDLDGFKQINDAAGLPAGDQVLTITAFRLVGCLKSTDWVARLDGDEYALILHGIDNQANAARVATRVIETLGKPMTIENTPTFLGASIGIALHPGDGTDVPTLLRNAELALGRAKTSGGKAFQFFEPTMAAAAEQRRQLEADLRQAIVRQELRVYFQPIVDLAHNRLAGAEALVRWQHPQHGLVPPDAFIPLAEETGFILELGLWVVETAARQLAAWRAEGHDLYLSINVSARQIPDGLPAALLLDIASRNGLPPACLALEITEGVLLTDVERGIGWLTELRQTGFRAYLDDFGTGYSSLSYLKRFPMDTVKADQSFVRDMGGDNSDHALVEAIVMMARSLGLNVVAEGVETLAQLDLLRAMGCRYGQGYYFSRPVPADQFVATAGRIATLLATEEAVAA